MWNQLDQGVVDATSVNAFKSKLERLRYTRMDFSRTSSLSPKPPGGILLVRLHKVSNRVSDLPCAASPPGHSNYP